MVQRHNYRAVSVLTVLALLAGGAAHATDTLQPGSYRCWSFNVSGGGGSCRLAPPIVIDSDGNYRESSARGTYRIKGDRIAFSGSTIRGPGQILDGNKIRFEYDYKGLRHTVTYLRQN